MGADRIIRQGAARGAMWGIGQAPQRRLRGRFAPPQAGFFCAPASLPAFSDVPASQCDGRLAGAKNHASQMGPIYLKPLLAKLKPAG